MSPDVNILKYIFNVFFKVFNQNAHEGRIPIDIKTVKQNRKNVL